MNRMRILFEKLQIKTVARFPFTRVLISRFAVSGIQYHPLLHTIAGILGVLMLPLAVAVSVADRIRGRFAIGQATVILTTRCNLRCIHCSTLIPYSAHPQNMDTALVLEDIEKLFEAVDHIYAFQISGGEPFLHPDLATVIEKVLSIGRIKTLNVVTNGGVLPSAEALRALQDRRVKVQISGYPKHLVPQRARFIETLEEHSIAFGISADQKWKYLGDRTYVARSEDERKELLSLCAFSLCHHMFDGKYFICSFAAHGMDAGIIAVDPNDFVDVRNLDTATTRAQLQHLLCRPYTSACDYCLGNTHFSKTIPAAEQLS